MGLPFIERVEINLRCRIANYFCSTYGVLGYKDPGNFADETYHAAFLQDVESETFRNKNAPFIKNFLDNYENGDIPFYALVEILSFGTLSKFYKNMKIRIKNRLLLPMALAIHILRAGLKALHMSATFVLTTAGYIMPGFPKPPGFIVRTRNRELLIIGFSVFYAV